MNRMPAKLLCVMSALIMLILSGCSLDMPNTKKKTESGTDDDLYTIGIKNDIGGGGTTAEQGVIYDRCGVKFTLDSVNTLPLNFTVTNNSGKNVSLYSLYTAEDGTVSNDLDIKLTDIENGGIKTLTVPVTSGVSTIRTRLYLVDENYMYIEDSLSDPIELTVSDKLYLQTKPLYTLIYDDKDIKLGLKKVSYRDDSNVVRLTLYAENKTDKDIYLTGRNMRCVHEDFYATFAAAVPAGGRSDFYMRASTSNNTISAADLDSIAFSLEATDIATALTYENTNTIISTDELVIELPKNGRPEKVIPDTVDDSMTPAEYLENLMEEKELSSIPDPIGSADLSYEDEDISVEYIGGLFEVNDEDLLDLYFCFRCTNRLEKQIELEPFGSFNGATVSFYCSGQVPPMTQEYFYVEASSIYSMLFLNFSDAHISFNASYDDGHNDDSSFIKTIGPFDIVISEKLYRPEIPEDSKLLFSGKTCDVYYSGNKYNERYNRLDVYFYTVNKSDKTINMYISVPNDSDLWLMQGATVYAGTDYAERATLRYLKDDKTVSEDVIKGVKLGITVTDTDGNPLETGEGSI